MIGAGGLARDNIVGLASPRLSRSHRVHSRAQSRARPCPCNAPARDEGWSDPSGSIYALKTVTLEEKAPIVTLLQL
jgi:hypothetical protein